MKVREGGLQQRMQSSFLLPGQAGNLPAPSCRESMPIHSLRAGDTIGEHTLWLAGPGERIELKHVATRREVFAQGAIRLAGWLVTQGPGVHRP